MSIESDFWKFHRNNPDVYSRLLKMARQAKQRGVKQLGIGMLWEVLRWENTMTTNSTDGLKLNNNARAMYARLLMQRNPDLAGIFVIRQRRAVAEEPLVDPEAEEPKPEIRAYRPGVIQSGSFGASYTGVRLKTRN